MNQVKLNYIGTPVTPIAIEQCVDNIQKNITFLYGDRYQVINTKVVDSKFTCHVRDTWPDLKSIEVNIIITPAEEKVHKKPLSRFELILE